MLENRKELLDVRIMSKIVSTLNQYNARNVPEERHEEEIFFHGSI